MRDWLSDFFAGRPAWINALMVFCAFMAFVYVPWDFLVKPMARDQEVWLGIMLTGLGAKLTEPLHWAIYAAGFYGFYRMRSWMWPWAAAYAASVAIGMLVWPLLYQQSFALLMGAVGFVPFALLARELWRAEPLFDEERVPMRERYGEWALVTGASAGIGEAFARALAREGMSVVLSARRRDRLEAIASELEKTFSVQTRVVEEDLANAEGAERVARAVSDLPIAVLVNNAGFGAAGRFDKLQAERLRDMVTVNCVAPMLLARRILPRMQDRGRGAVIFTGSVSGRQPLPLHGVYAATKAFDQLLGEALYVEQRRFGIDVLVVEPGSTETEFHGVANELPHAGESPEAVVETALEALGRQPSVVSGWYNWLRANLSQRIAPRSMVAYLAHEYTRRQTPEDLQ
ncbi:MAG TPA: SDR family oxidoreductase [Myxococcota bacterium]|nr:SDR family oxidoreductase [Myxococcota bacterium]